MQDGSVTYCGTCGVRIDGAAAECPNCGAPVVRGSNTLLTGRPGGVKFGRALTLTGLAGVGLAAWLLVRRGKSRT
jgi:hypothetical protein